MEASGGQGRIACSPGSAGCEGGAGIAREWPVRRPRRDDNSVAGVRRDRGHGVFGHRGPGRRRVQLPGVGRRTALCRQRARRTGGNRQCQLRIPGRPRSDLMSPHSGVINITHRQSLRAAQRDPRPTDLQPLPITAMVVSSNCNRYSKTPAAEYRQCRTRRRIRRTVNSAKRQAPASWPHVAHDLPSDWNRA